MTVAIPEPSVFDDAPLWITFGVIAGLHRSSPLAVGTYWITRRTVIALRWAIEERKPTRDDERNTFLAPWRLAIVDLILWGIRGRVADDALRAWPTRSSSRGSCSR